MPGKILGGTHTWEGGKTGYGLRTEQRKYLIWSTDKITRDRIASICPRPHQFIMWKLYPCISQGSLEEQNLQNLSLSPSLSYDFLKWLTGCGPAIPLLDVYHQEFRPRIQEFSHPWGGMSQLVIVIFWNPRAAGSKASEGNKTKQTNKKFAGKSTSRERASFLSSCPLYRLPLGVIQIKSGSSHIKDPD